MGRCAARSSLANRDFVTLRTKLVYAGGAHRPSAEAVEAPRFLSDCQTGPECPREPVRVLLPQFERSTR
jgi:hypothetical protein